MNLYDIAIARKLSGGGGGGGGDEPTELHFEKMEGGLKLTETPNEILSLINANKQLCVKPPQLSYPLADMYVAIYYTTDNGELIDITFNRPFPTDVSDYSSDLQFPMNNEGGVMVWYIPD